jgi:hypothetical protein
MIERRDYDFGAWNVTQSTSITTLLLFCTAGMKQTLTSNIRKERISSRKKE